MKSLINHYSAFHMTNINLWICAGMKFICNGTVYTVLHTSPDRIEYRNEDTKTPYGYPKGTNWSTDIKLLT